MLPTFIVIGAMKSGTTSLYYYLNAHPEIDLSAIKETDFFVEQKNYHRGTDWYESLFGSPTHKARGEVSPNYTKCHLFSNVPARMHALLPEIKLIYLLRDPIERTVSHYVGSVAYGREQRSLQDALQDLEDNNYVLTSRYYLQLEPYLEYYDTDRILVVSSWKLKHERKATLRRIYRFLEVDETFQQVSTKQFNRSSEMKRRSAWYRFISNRLLSQRLKDRLRPYLPTPLLPGTSLSRPELDPMLRDKLTAYFSEDVATLRAHTGQAFEHWSL